MSDIKISIEIDGKRADIVIDRAMYEIARSKAGYVGDVIIEYIDVVIEAAKECELTNRKLIQKEIDDERFKDS